MSGVAGGGWHVVVDGAVHAVQAWVTECEAEGIIRQTPETTPIGLSVVLATDGCGPLISAAGMGIMRQARRLDAAPPAAVVPQAPAVDGPLTAEELRTAQRVSDLLRRFLAVGPDAVAEHMLERLSTGDRQEHRRAYRIICRRADAMLRQAQDRLPRPMDPSTRRWVAMAGWCPATSRGESEAEDQRVTMQMLGISPVAEVAS